MIEYRGIDFVTTAPAAMHEPRPMVTPDNNVTLMPSQESPSIITSRHPIYF